MRATLPSRHVYTQQYSLMYSAPFNVVALSFCCTAAVSPSTMIFQGSRFIVERSNILPDTPPVSASTTFSRPTNGPAPALTGRCHSASSVSMESRPAASLAPRASR